MSIESDGLSPFEDYHYGHFDHVAEALRQEREEKAKAAAELLAAQWLDGLELAKASAAQVDEKLKERMNAIFDLLRQIAEKREEAHSTADQQSLTKNAYERYPSPNLRQSLAQIKECIAVNIELCEKYNIVHTTSQLNYVELTRQTFAIRLAANGLRDACVNIASHCSAEVQAALTYLGAARHLAEAASKSPHLATSTMGMREVIYDPTQDANEQEQQQALLDLIEKLAGWASDAFRLGDKLEALRPILERVQGIDDILEPVRPTEEEVQRYMMQLEQRMRERIKVHIEVKPLLAEKFSLGARYQMLQEAIRKCIESTESTEKRKRGPKLGAIVEISTEVTTKAERAQQHLRNSNRWDSNTIDGLKTTSKPDATDYDTKTLPMLRDVIKAHAYSLGRHNEAKAAQSATRAASIPKPSRAGVTGCKSVKHALAWQDQHEAEVAAATKKNYSREVKLELLVESVRAYREEVEASETRVHRQTVSFLPGKGVMPCDELRALFNAAAALYKGNDSFDEGRFPLF